MDSSINKVFSLLELISLLFRGLEFNRVIQLSTLNTRCYTAASLQSRFLIEKQADKACICSINRILNHRMKQDTCSIIDEFKIVFSDNTLDTDLGNLLKTLFQIGVRKLNLVNEGGGYSNALTGVVDGDATLQSLSITRFRCTVQVKKFLSLRNLTLINNSYANSKVLSEIFASCEIRTLILEGYCVAKSTITLGSHLMKFDYRFGWYPTVCISPHSNLTHFSLTSTTIDDQQLSSAISEMPNLRQLLVSDCNKLQHLLITSQSIVSVLVTSCDSVVKLSLTTPNLKSLSFHTLEFRRPLYVDPVSVTANGLSANFWLIQRSAMYDKTSYCRDLKLTLEQFANPITLTFTLTLETPSEPDCEELLHMIEGIASITIISHEKKTRKGKITVTLVLTLSI